jgi:pteridine reductase
MVESENTVLITGSGKRLGKELATFFAEKKWNIVLHSYHSFENVEKIQNELKKFNIKTYAIKFNLENIQEIENGFQQINKEFIFPNVLINNAAIYPPKYAVEDISQEIWDNIINLNLRSQFFTSKEFSKYCRPNSRIINIASLGAFFIWKNRLPYNVAKAGLIQLNKALAKELAPKISVNAISPGIIELADEASEQNPNLVDKIPFARYATARDIFDAAYFFATCTNYITGQNLIIDGGLSL